MQNPLWVKAALFTFFTVAIAIGGWEIWLRTHGNNISYDDGRELWSHVRGMVYEPSDKATVFIGSSRNKYDIDIATWQRMTGDHAIQLAIEGESPIPILDDLANDKKFKGKLIVDVTEGLFFSTGDNNLTEPRARIDYYKKLTPAQRASFHLNHGLESAFVFLDKDSYSLNAMLDKLEVKSRPGVFMMPIFPRDFGNVKFNRQDFMTDRFVSDTNLQRQVKNIWMFFASMNKEPPMGGAQLDSFMNAVKVSVDKIKGRGGQILFVRTPSSGPYWQGELKGFPRDKYWDRLLQVTGCPGIHFKDYPATDHFECPEWSHLRPSDAKIWTENLVQIIRDQKGWSFPHQPLTSQ